MAKIVIYKYEDIQSMTALLNGVSVSGFGAINAMAAVGKIIDGGEVKNMHIPEEKVVSIKKEGNVDETD